MPWWERAQTHAVTRLDARMFLGRILGLVVATVKTPGLEGVPLLIMEPLDEDLESAGEPIVVADGIGVGRGEIVFWEGGREAPLALGETLAPVDAAVVGIVDSLGKITPRRRRRAGTRRKPRATMERK